MSMVTETSKKHITSLLSLSDNILDKLMSFYSNKFKDRDYNNLFSQSEVKKAKIDQDDKKLIDSFIALYNIAKFSVKEEYLTSFIRQLKEAHFEDSQITRIREMIDKMKKYQLIDEIVDLEDRKEIERLGLPRLTNIGMSTNYRIFTNHTHEKELIPVIQCNIVINNEESNETKSVDFQFLPRELDSIIEYFEKFKNDMQKDNVMVSSKLGMKW